MALGCMTERGDGEKWPVKEGIICTFICHNDGERECQDAVNPVEVRSALYPPLSD